MILRSDETSVGSDHTNRLIVTSVAIFQLVGSSTCSPGHQLITHTDSEYESLKIELAERIDEATAAIEKLNKEKREILDGVSKQQSWVEQFRQYENVTELTRPMVIHLIERINIFEDSNIEIVFRHRNQIEEILQFISEKTADKKLLAMPIREVG